MPADLKVDLKQLQLKFRQVQQQQSVLKLSEHSCVEIVQRLVNLGLIQVHFTADGKEFMTPEHLEKEILAELEANFGRVPLPVLATSINIDYGLVEEKVKALLLKDPSLTLEDGELLKGKYLDDICLEINEELQESGYIQVGDMATKFKLTLPLMQSLVQKQLGRLIKGSVDPSNKDLLYTDHYVSRQKAMIRGAFRGVTRPIAISQIRTRSGANEGLFDAITQTLSTESCLSGTIKGGTYVPAISQQTQANWINSFFSQNGFIDFDTLRRLEIDDPVKFARKAFPDQLFLHDRVINKTLLHQVDASIEDALSRNAVVDIWATLPFQVSEKDTTTLLQECPAFKNDANAVILGGHFVSTKKLLVDCFQLLESLVKTRAQAMKQTPSQSTAAAGAKKPAQQEVAANDDDDDWGTKGKKGKGKPVKKAKQPEGGAKGTEDKLNTKELLQALEKSLPDFESDLAVEILQIHTEALTEVHEAAMKVTHQGVTAQERKKEVESTVEKLEELRVSINLFQKGAEQVEGDPGIQLQRHLQKTLCSSYLDLIFAHQYLVTLEREAEPEEKLNIDPPLPANTRTAILQRVPPQISASLKKLVTLQGSKEPVNTLLEAIQAESSQLGLHFKKIDRKKERQALLKEKEWHLQNLNAATDPALTLHLVVLILFSQIHKTSMLHATGKFVPSILSHLQPLLNDTRPGVYEQLFAYQNLVIQHLTGAGEKQQTQLELQERLPIIKNLALGSQDVVPDE